MPTPFLRFWYALGVQPVENPPHRPDLNPFVERLHGTLEREYRQRIQPGSLEATRESLPAFVVWCEREARTLWRRYLGAGHHLTRAS